MPSDDKKGSATQADIDPKRDVLAGYFDDLLKSPEELDTCLVESNDPEFGDCADTATISPKDCTLPEKNASNLVAQPSPAAVNEGSFSETPSAQNTYQDDGHSEVFPAGQTSQQVSLEALAEKTDWEADNFDALLVRLDHASLAIPLLLIGSVYKVEQNLVNIANQPAWFLGIYPYNGQNIKVLDTQYLVTNTPLDIGHDAPPKYIMTIANSPYGLACCGVEKVLKLSEKDIRWRSENRNKKWYRGIVKEYMCVLLDAQQLLEEWL